MAQKGKRGARSGSPRTRNNKRTSSTKQRPTPRQRALAAKVASQMRRGKTWTAALRAVGTTARNVCKGGGDLFYRDKSGRVQARPSDQKRFRLRVITDDGYVTVAVRGNKPRKIAGDHRNTVLKVLRHELPETELERFRNSRVGGQRLFFDPAKLPEVGIILEVQPERELYADLDVGGAA